MMSGAFTCEPLIDAELARGAENLRSHVKQMVTSGHS